MREHAAVRLVSLDEQGGAWLRRGRNTVDIAVSAARAIADRIRGNAVAGFDGFDAAWTDRHLAVAAWQIEHVCWLRKARQPPAQAANQRLTARDRSPKMRGAGRSVEVVQVVGLHAAFD